MSINSFKILQVPERILQTIQQNCAQTFNDVLNAINTLVSDVTTLKSSQGVALSASFGAVAVSGSSPVRYDLRLTHSLGSVPTDFVVGNLQLPQVVAVGSPADPTKVSVYVSPNNSSSSFNPDPSKYLVLSCSQPNVTCVVTVS